MHQTWHLKYQKRRWTNVGGINKGLHALNVAYVHLASDIGVRQWQGESSLESVHLAIDVANNKNNQSRHAHMSRCACISYGRHWRR